MCSPFGFLENDMAAHARLGPSGAEKWMICPGSIELEALFPDEDPFGDDGPTPSAEGTAAHWLREHLLGNGGSVKDWIGEWIDAGGFSFEVEPEWYGYLQPGIERIREFSGEWVFEKRLDMTKWIPDGFGTLDAGGYNDDVIIIDDLKFGRIPVWAERNKQLMIYALAFWWNIARHKTKATKFILRIDQPRVPGYGDEWHTTLEELLAFGEEVREKALLVVPGAPRVPSPKGCFWCRGCANAACPELDQYMLAQFGVSEEELIVGKKIPMHDADALTPEQRSAIIANKSLFNKWLTTLESDLIDRASRGEDVPDYKAVPTEGTRRWDDEAAVEALCQEYRVPRNEVYKTTLLSPTQMEKVVPTKVWAKLQKHVVRPEGKPALVPDADKRLAIIPLADMLDDLDDIEDDVSNELDDLIGLPVVTDLDWELQQLI